jgi:hypothetical protein
MQYPEQQSAAVWQACRKSLHLQKPFTQDRVPLQQSLASAQPSFPSPTHWPQVCVVVRQRVPVPQQSPKAVHGAPAALQQTLGSPGSGTTHGICLPHGQSVAVVHSLWHTPLSQNAPASHAKHKGASKFESQD